MTGGGTDAAFVPPFPPRPDRLPPWRQPVAFLPARFLPGAARPPRHGYILFGTGPRICTGQQFDLMEAVIALASLAQDARLRLTLRPGEALPMLRVARQAGAAWQPVRARPPARPNARPSGRGR